MFPMHTRRFTAFALLLLGLVACSSDSNNDGADVAPVALCVNSSCGERIELMPFPSAENLLFTDSGRLFVSGAGGVYEIQRDASGAYTRSLASEGCTGGLGLAQRGNLLYAVCSGMKIFAGELSAAPMLREIFTLEDMCIPNGMALGADGNLYVVDEPLNFCVPDPSIVRLTVNPANPTQILSQETWVQGSPAGLLAFGVGNTLRFPNGLQSVGARFYGTDGGSVYAVDLQADGTPGPVQPLFFEATAHDDLGVAGDFLLVTDFVQGAIVQLTLDGEFVDATDPGTFSFPSSVRLGRPPLFEPGDIVVTETGVLTDNNLPLDYLSVFRRRAE